MQQGARSRSWELMVNGTQLHFDPSPCLRLSVTTRFTTGKCLQSFELLKVGNTIWRGCPNRSRSSPITIISTTGAHSRTCPVDRPAGRHGCPGLTSSSPIDPALRTARQMPCHNDPIIQDQMLKTTRARWYYTQTTLRQLQLACLPKMS